MMSKEKQRSFYNSTAWRRKRDQILAANNYECLWCKKEGRVTTREHAILEVDHILELETHPELCLEDNNLRVLCKAHHNKRHNRFEFAPGKKTKWDDEKW